MASTNGSVSLVRRCSRQPPPPHVEESLQGVGLAVFQRAHAGAHPHDLGESPRPERFGRTRSSSVTLSCGRKNAVECLSCPQVAKGLLLRYHPVSTALTDKVNTASDRCCMHILYIYYSWSSNLEPCGRPSLPTDRQTGRTSDLLLTLIPSRVLSPSSSLCSMTPTWVRRQRTASLC